MAAKATKTEDGVPVVQSTPKPFGTTTYFTGSGDDVNSDPNVIGAGAKLIFKMLSTDSSKEVSIEFLEDVFIKDGYMIFKNAPLGSCIDAFILSAGDTVLGAFGRKIPLLGDGRVTLDTNDRFKLLKGFKIKIIVHNSTGQGEEENASAFNVACMLELFRIVT